MELITAELAYEASRPEGLEERLPLYIQDFTVKPTMAESQDIHPQNTSIVIIETEKDILHIESLPSMTENFRGAIKLPSNTRKCILSLHGDKGRYFGLTELGKVDLESLRLGPDKVHRLERGLATDEDLEPYLISFSFSVGPRDAVQLACGRQELDNPTPSPRWNLSLYLLTGDADTSTRDPDLLNVAGHLFLERYVSSKLQMDLDNSSRAYELAVKMLSPSDVECSKYQVDASVAYYNRFHLLGKIFDIRHALVMLQSAIDRAPDGLHDIGAYQTGLTQNMDVAFDWTKYFNIESENISSILGEIESGPEGDANLHLVDRLATCLRIRFERSRYVAELFETTLTTFRKVCFLGPSGDSNDSGLVVNLDDMGLSLRNFFEEGAIDPEKLSMMITSLQDASFQLPPTADLADINGSVSLHRKVIQNTHNDDPELPDYFIHFGDTLQCQFEHTGNQNDLTMAISSLQCAVDLTPEGDIVLPVRWIKFGKLLKQRFELNRDEDDLQKAISAHRSAVKSSQINDIDCLETLNDFGVILLFSFDHTENYNYVSEAVTTFQEIVGRTPTPNDSRLPRFLNNLGESLCRRFEQSQAREDLSEAISSIEKALEISSDTEEIRSILFNNLGLAFTVHFKLENDTKGSPTSELGNGIGFRFVYQVQSRVKRSPDSYNPSLNKAIDCHRMAVKLSQHPALHNYLRNLAAALHSRFKIYGDSADLTEALSAIQRAIDIAPKRDKRFLDHLDKLEELLWDRFERDSSPDDLSQVISTCQFAIDLTPSDDLNALCRRRSNLGNALMASFDRSGDVGESSTAIMLFRKVIRDATLHEYLDLPHHLNNLGESLRRQFEHGGLVADLSEAISSLQKAAEIASERNKFDKRIPAFLNNLANAFQIRFKRYKDPDDISAAVSSQERAVNFTPPIPDLRESLLNNLGLFLLGRFEINKEPKDILDAISSFREAIQLTHNNTTALPLWKSNLSRALHQRFESNGNSEYLIEAIELQEEAIRLTPESHPFWSRRIYNLGVSCEALYASTNDVKDVLYAMSQYRQAATSLTGFPSSRIVAARKWARCSEKHDPSQTLEAYNAAIELLSEYAAINETVEGRQAGLKNISGLASGAAAAAFTRGEVELGLEWLERGRCIVWTQLDQLRAPFKEHIAKHPELKVKLERLQRVSEQLETLGSRDIGKDEKASLEEETIEHVKFAKEYNRLLEDIRHSGIDNFLQPRKTEDILSKLPQNGLVILINVHEDQGHALALTPNVPLAAISLKRVCQKWAEKLRSQLEACISPHTTVVGGPLTEEKPPSVLSILRALWVDLVKPVFNAIGYRERPESPHRIWWCVTGPLAFLPIHAAGLYGKSGVCISDFAISSYIPNISTLLDHGRKIPEEAEPRVLLVSQGEALDMPTISGVKKETDEVRKLMEEHGLSVKHLSGNDATVGNAIKEMSSCHWVHFACHATQEPVRPLTSAFHLLDRQLSIFDIIKLKNPDFDLAFLSACETSTGDEQLSDEAVHLAAGMLAAGCRGVVSTMWSIKDTYAVNVAESFYSHLLNRAEEEGKPWPDSTGAAHAIHHAAQSLRMTLGNHKKAFPIWVPYVHFGI